MGTVTVDEVCRDVTAFIVDHFLFGNKADAPGPESSFLATGLIDSTGLLDVIEHLGSRWGVTVDPEEIMPENLDSVARIAAFVVRKKGG